MAPFVLRKSKAACPITASMRRIPAAIAEVEIIVKHAISEVLLTWHLPHSSWEKFPNSTTLTISPYFSPKSAIQPVCSRYVILRSFKNVGILRSERFSFHESFDLFQFVFGWSSKDIEIKTKGLVIDSTASGRFSVPLSEPGRRQTGVSWGPSLLGFSVSYLPALEVHGGGVDLYIIDSDDGNASGDDGYGNGGYASLLAPNLEVAYDLTLTGGNGGYAKLAATNMVISNDLTVGAGTGGVGDSRGIGANAGGGFQCGGIQSFEN
jgi:hypothetical protein